MTQFTTNYFDLHTNGIGYLNRIREVSVRKGTPFMAVTVAALHGAADQVEYTYIDCKVAGGEAERLIRRCQQAESAGRKILVAFRIGDLWIDTFTYDRGEKIGQTGASLKGRLLFITWIKIDGETVYQAPEKEPAQPVETAPSLSDEAEPASDGTTTENPLPAQTEEAPAPKLSKPSPTKPRKTTTSKKAV